MSRDTDAKTVARNLDVAKCEVYRAIASLQKNGLVEKSVTIPAVYRATPIKDATRILLDKYTMEYNNLQKLSETIVNNFDGWRNITSEEKDQDLSINEGKIVGKRLVDQLHKSKTIFETISTWKISIRMLSDHLDEFRSLTEKGVIIHILTDRSMNPQVSFGFLKELQENPFFEIRYYKEPLILKMAICDKKEVNFCLSDRHPSPNITSNNRVFAQLAVKCFECMWNEAQIV
jgi:sugar-specific transcriptional regulator TrmB